MTTAGSARLGIYDTASTGRPGTLVLDAGTISFTANNQVHTVTISQPLEVGWYWFAMVVQSGLSSWQGYSSGSSIGALNTQRAFALTSTNSAGSYLVNSVTGTLPSTPTWTHTNSSGFMIKVGF